MNKKIIPNKTNQFLKLILNIKQKINVYKCTTCIEIIVIIHFIYISI